MYLFWLRWVFGAAGGVVSVAALGLLIAVAPPVEEHRLWGTQASVAVAHGLNCSTAMWNLPGPGIKPMSPALAGRFLSTVPLRKFLLPIFKFFSINELYKLLIYFGN